MSSDFAAALSKHVTPVLQSLGYAYDVRLCLDDELYGFRKELGADVHAVIQFRYRQDAAQHDFTVNLFTAKCREIQPRMYGGYAGARGARLSYVMWFVHGLRDYAVPDYWWVAPDESLLPAALEEALSHIERYGIPWLESRVAAKPWEMPVSRADEFDRAIQSVMAPAMEQLGYHLERQSLPGHRPYCYFSKVLPDGSFGLIELQSIYSLDPNEFNFDVRLQRCLDRDPLAFNGDYGRCSISLAQLVYRSRGGLPLDRLSVPEVKALFWRYRDRAELNGQLTDALEQIQRIGSAWIEQAAANSKMIQ